MLIDLAKDHVGLQRGQVHLVALRALVEPSWNSLVLGEHVEDLERLGVLEESRD